MSQLVFDERSVRDRQKWFGKVDRDRTQPGSLTSGQNHSLYVEFAHFCPSRSPLTTSGAGPDSNNGTARWLVPLADASGDELPLLPCSPPASDLTLDHVRLMHELA